ncbi:MAG: hypothetical protein IPM37_12495 [Hahellaceae bacterium]|nr:hypothetical protein [Hahellaceae bacterium]
MQVPDNGNRYTSNVPAQSAGLTYKVKFEQSGTYYVWARTKSPSANSNTLHVGLNGSLSAAGTSLTDSSTAGVYEWINQASGGVAQITVSSAGVHTVNVWMDKDGVLLDKLVLTRNSAFIPKLLGPVQSEQGAYRSYPSTPGSTLASWSFDSDPSGGSTRDGVSQRELTCASCPSRVTGIEDKAYQFGSGTGLDLPAGAFNLSSAVGFAVETRVRFSSCTTAQGMVGSVSPSSSYQWVIGCESSRVVATMSDSNGNGSGIKLQSSTGQDNGAWHHVVLVRDGVFSETRLYVDGQLADTRSVTRGPLPMMHR